MPNYKLFNDKIENILDFKRSTPAWLEVVCNIQEWGKECNVYNGIFDYATIDSYAKYVDYMSTVITSFLSCDEKEECIRFASNTLSVSELLYMISRKTLVKDDIPRFKEQFKDDIPRLNDQLNDIFLELSEMPLKMEQLKSKISRFLVKSGCIDEFFTRSFESDKEKINLVIEYKDIIMNQISELKYSTLICLQELIIKYKKDNVIDFNEPNNKSLNDIKEIFVNEGLDILLQEFDVSGETDEEKVLNIFDNGSKIDELSPEVFYDYIEKNIINKFNNLSEEKCKEKKMLSFYNAIFEIKRIWNESKQALLNCSSIEESIVFEMKNREDNYIKSLLVLSDDDDINDKKTIIEEYLKLGYDNTTSSTVKKQEFRNCDIESVIQKAVAKIISNEKIVNQIVAGEHLFKKLDSIEINNELKGDYTFLVASQIKTVERFIKESMLKNLNGCDILEDDEGNYYSVNGRKTLDTLDLNQDKIMYTAELGTLNVFLSNCLNPYHGYHQLQNKIFDNHRINPSYSIFRYGTFYKEFVNKIRNGHFHTSIIDCIERAQYFRKETAFWLLCVINELKGI